MKERLEQNLYFSLRKSVFIGNFFSG